MDVSGNLNSYSHTGVLNLENVNGGLRQAQYAVRGEIYLAAQKRLQAGKEVILTNVGNPHALGQKPITFNRQVMALVMAPFLLDDPNVTASFPPDAIERAKNYLANVKGGLGAYSDSKGNPYVRTEIAEFFSKRDQCYTDPEHIFLTNGASEAVRMCLRALIRGPQDAVMVPVPQYPLYSASIGLYDGKMVGYGLHEDSGWSLQMDELKKQWLDAKSRGLCVRGLVFINPGNPTGQCLTEEMLRDLITFCFDHKIAMMADEVYQENVYQTQRPFISARCVLHKMSQPYKSGVELCSFHTVSKGAYGECGLRGGMVHLCNIDIRTHGQLYKLASINLSPNIPGQLALGMMLNPPKPGDPSYPLYNEERTGVIDSLKRRARMLTDAFNALPGMTCECTEGALYAFPRIRLPPKAIAAAREMGKQPDVFYCLALLEETGLSTVPGSGFGQEDGTFHFRTTILPEEERFQEICDLFSSFHIRFMEKYAGEAPRVDTGSRL